MFEYRYIKLVKAGISVMSTKGRKTLQVQVLVCMINKYSFVNSVNPNRLANVNQ